MTIDNKIEVIERLVGYGVTPQKASDIYGEMSWDGALSVDMDDVDYYVRKYIKTDDPVKK